MDGDRNYIIIVVLEQIGKSNCYSIKGHAGRQTDGRMDGWTERWIDRRMDGHTEKQTGRRMDGWIDGWTEKRMDIQTDR